MFLQQLVNGLALGSVYALVSIGYTMVYGILFFVNFPHGEFLMVGTFIALVLVLAKVPFVFAVVIAMALSATVGVFVERLAYSRLRYGRRLAPLLSAILPAQNNDIDHNTGQPGRRHQRDEEGRRAAARRTQDGQSLCCDKTSVVSW